MQVPQAARTSDSALAPLNPQFASLARLDTAHAGHVGKDEARKPHELCALWYATWCAAPWRPALSEKIHSRWAGLDFKAGLSGLLMCCARNVFDKSQSEVEA